MPSTEVGSKSGGLIWEDENFHLGYVKFEVLVEHQSRDIQLVMQNARHAQEGGQG